MSESSIELKALEFDQNDSGPDWVTARFPAQLLYTLAAFHGPLPPLLFRPATNEQFSEFYGFVSGYVASRFFDDGLNDAAPRHSIIDGQYQLAYHEVGSKAPDAPQQVLAEQLAGAISAHFGESSNAQTNHERRDLAERLAQCVINHGWRQTTPIK